MCTAQTVLCTSENAHPHTLTVLLCGEAPHSRNLGDIRKLLEEILESLAYNEPRTAAIQIQKSRNTDCVSDSVHPAEISDILCRLGMPSNLLGYRYLRFAILAVAENPELLRAVTKMLYPMVAEEFCTSASGIERAMRHAIEVVWSRGDPDVLQDYFGNTVDPDRGKPTNTEFIAKIVDSLIIKYAECSHK